VRHPFPAEIGNQRTVTLTMSVSTRFVVFTLDGQRYALPLATVERIVRAVEVNALPKAPPIVLGVINVEGRVLPVLNIRRRFRLPEPEISPADQLVIARTAGRTVALVVDQAQGVIECPHTEVIGSAQIVPGLEQIQGVVKLPDGLVLIHDLETFLSLDEAQALDESMSREVAHAT
jgi:purine-binding chemotaxis protein CheW